MKTDLVVIANQQVAVNTFSLFVQINCAFRFGNLVGETPTQEKQNPGSEIAAPQRKRAGRRAKVAVVSLKIDFGLE